MQHVEGTRNLCEILEGKCKEKRLLGEFGVDWIIAQWVVHFGVDWMTAQWVVQFVLVVM